MDQAMHVPTRDDLSDHTPLMPTTERVRRRLRFVVVRPSLPFRTISSLTVLAPIRRFLPQQDQGQRGNGNEESAPGDFNSWRIVVSSPSACAFAAIFLFVTIVGVMSVLAQRDVSHVLFGTSTASTLSKDIFLPANANDLFGLHDAVLTGYASPFIIPHSRGEEIVREAVSTLTREVRNSATFTDNLSLVDLMTDQNLHARRVLFSFFPRCTRSSDVEMSSLVSRSFPRRFVRIAS